MFKDFLIYFIGSPPVFDVFNLGATIEYIMASILFVFAFIIIFRLILAFFNVLFH